MITSSDGRVSWAAGTGGNNGGKDIMQSDGDFVIYDNPGANGVIFSTD